MDGAKFKLRVFFDPRCNNLVRSVVISTVKTTFFNIEVKSEDLELNLKHAYSTIRGQYDGERILAFLMKRSPDEFFFGVLPDDLYVRGLNFVFGVAYPGRGAVMSLYRLTWHADENLFQERIEKTVKHELGHVFGLSHCANICVMRFANSLYELDIKSKEFCPECKARLREIGLFHK